jgi:hypothetical protein
MARETTKSGKLGDLTRFTAALAANTADLPHLEGSRLRLDKVVGDAQDAAKQQAFFTAGKQEASKRLETLVTEGQRLATGIRKLLTQTYGIRSEKLAEFGLQPFRGRKLVKKGETGKPGNPEPPATPTAPPATKP